MNTFSKEGARLVQTLYVFEVEAFLHTFDKFATATTKRSSYAQNYSIKWV